MSSSNELMVVSREDLERLITAASNLRHTAEPAEAGEGDDVKEFIVQKEFMVNLGVALEVITSAPLKGLLRNVEASGVDAEAPVLVVLPPWMKDSDAAAKFERAVTRAASLSGDGQRTSYWEALEDSLAMHGIEIQQEIQHLQAQTPWDQADIPEEPSHIEEGDPDWVRVEMRGPLSLDGHSDCEIRLGDGSLVVVAPTQSCPDFFGFVESLEVRYPSAEKYGVPQEATEAGAAEFVVDVLGYSCSKNMDVRPIDTGDDSGGGFVATCIMPRELIAPADVSSDRPRV